LLILSSGHNVAPEPIEDDLQHAIPGAQQVVLFGNGKSYLVALICGPADASRAETAIEQLNAGLPHYRQIRGWHIEPQPLTIESGMLTANGKLRRDLIAAHFREAIEGMYERTAQKA
jgi:long-chain acyl-CoA synthetase